MAKNDVVLLDSLLQQQFTARSGTDVGEPFERFVLEQILKHFDLSSEELDFGWTDGSLDGGIDGFYILINGRLLTDPADFAWPRTAAEIQVFLVTCKHHDTFQQVPLDAMLASVQELFDLSRSTADLTGSYSADIRKCREVFIAAFRQLSLYRPTLSFSVIYASRGDTKLLGKSISARAMQLKTLLNSYFSASSATFTALGASELVELHREVKSFALDLPVQECLTAGQEGYVVLARLIDYSAFVSDDKGQLRRYLFDSNVRAYLGTNLVNVDIAETLSNSLSPNFWWLNNGVTILATSASLVGKTLKLKDIQIVNGLQTTESIYRYYSSTPPLSVDHRSLLVKVIVSQEENVRDQVIRATNNQSLVEPAALHATDRIQRSIEEILIRHDWYYERRTNYFKNEGRPDARIISPLVIATGSVALLLKNPVKSSKLKQKHLRTDAAYQAAFSESFPIETWPVVAALMRGAENAILRSHHAHNSGRGQHLSAWRGILAYFAAVRQLGTFDYSLNNLASLDVSKLTDTYLSECWSAISMAASSHTSNKLSESRMTQISIELTILWSLDGQWLDGRRPLPSNSVHVPMQPHPEYEEFLIKVNAALPEQPWKPSIHIEVGKQLGEEPSRVSKAIKTLIKRGVRMKQINGIVFDQSGNEVMRDEARSLRKIKQKSGTDH